MQSIVVISTEEGRQEPYRNERVVCSCCRYSRTFPTIYCMKVEVVKTLTGLLLPFVTKESFGGNKSQNGRPFRYSTRTLMMLLFLSFVTVTRALQNIGYWGRHVPHSSFGIRSLCLLRRAHAMRLTGFDSTQLDSTLSCPAGPRQQTTTKNEYYRHCGDWSIHQSINPSIDRSPSSLQYTQNAHKSTPMTLSFLSLQNPWQYRWQRTNKRTDERTNDDDNEWFDEKQEEHGCC